MKWKKNKPAYRRLVCEQLVMKKMTLVRQTEHFVKRILLQLESCIAGIFNLPVIVANTN